MGIHRRTYLTTLDPEREGARIDALAVLVGSVAAAVRLAVIGFFGGIDAGILPADFRQMQALASKVSKLEVEEGIAPSASGAQGRLGKSAGSGQARSPRRFLIVRRQLDCPGWAAASYLATGSAASGFSFLPTRGLVYGL